MTKRVALVSANNFKVPYPVYPLGVSYLCSYLQRHCNDIAIELFDFNLGSLEDYVSFLNKGNYDVIGISLRNIDDTNIMEKNNFIFHYKRIIDCTREHSHSPIVVGGPGFSVFPESIYAELNPDYGIKGEGEESLRMLIEMLCSHHLELALVEGLVYRDTENRIIINPRTCYIESPTLEVNPVLADYYWEHSGMLNIQTKRGCPYRCIYCSYPLIDGSKVRTLDAKMVVSNIEEMYVKNKINYLFFTDSVFNINKSYNEELAHRLIESKVKIRWGAYFSPRDLTIEDWKLYQASGLTHVEFGTDSLSDSQLRNYNKQFNFSDIEKQSRYCSELGIFYAHFLILGGYGETEQSLDETFENSRKLGLTVLFPYIGMRIYPSTLLCELALKEGVITSEEELINPVYYVSKQISIDTIEERAKATCQKWIFPNDKRSDMIEKFRAKRRKGPLWEYLRY